ncbi:MAG: hypothetical protein SFU25_02945 [Candidatus Caenarcaniphilales bacterium]|nr:hypothetical protein [Candidatus Caenarcaniphilales bacterium]
MKVGILNSARILRSNSFSSPIKQFIFLNSVSTGFSPNSQDDQVASSIDEQNIKSIKTKKSRIPELFDKWILPISGLILLLASGALGLAFYGRNTLVELYIQQENLPKDLRKVIMANMPSVFSSEHLTSYVNEGWRALFNNLAENLVMKNKEYLYEHVKQKVNVAS